jgi:adenylate cyclase class 2
MGHQEIEVRFLEIDKEALISRLKALGAEDILEEKIIYDKELTWNGSVRKMLRLRTQKGKTKLAYKYREGMSAEGTEEIEFEISDADSAEALLERLGYVLFREQQKRRHTFRLGEVIVDIDTWPKIPPYVELEGPSVESLMQAAESLELDWNTVEMRDPKTVIEEVYKVPLRDMRWFTFGRFE